MDGNLPKKQPNLPLLNLPDKPPNNSESDPFLTFSPISLSQILIEADTRRKSSVTIKPKGDEKSFTLDDDLLIFRTIRLFYGSDFDGKVNFLFWQVFKKSTGSPYTTSELSHHWNFLSKKYDTRVKTIDDCILEVKEKIDRIASQSHSAPTKNRLVRSKSYQALPIQVARSARNCRQSSRQTPQTNHVNTARPKDTSKLLSVEPTNTFKPVPIST